MLRTPILPAAALLLAAACAAPRTAEEGVEVREVAEIETTVVPVPAEAAAAVTVHYRHERTCARFLGREGRYYVVRLSRIHNAGAEPFTFEPARLRFREDGSGPPGPALLVPELSDAEAAGGGETAVDELFLVERDGAAGASRDPVELRYDAAGVRMVREGPAPAYDDGTGCDDLNT